MSIALMFHVLGVVIWVGGMFFAYIALRPVAAQILQAPERLRVWGGVFARFFPWVWLSIVAIFASGFFMILAKGGYGFAVNHINVMLGVGVVMLMIFGHVYFAAFKRLKRAVAAEDWQTGAAKLSQIRTLVGLNLILGLLNVAIATAGIWFD